MKIIVRVGTVMAVLFCLGVFGSCADEKKPMTDEKTAQRVTDSSWSVFRGTESLSGVSMERLPARLVLAAALRADDGITSTPVIWNKRLFVGSLDGKLLAFDLRRFARIWEFGTGDSIEAPPLVVPELGMVAVGSLDGSFFAVDAENGELRWRARTDGQIMGSANVAVSPADGRTLLLVGSYDNKLYCFDAGSGEELWTYQTGNFVNGTPALRGTTAVFGGCDAKLHVLDLAAGKERGVVDTGAYIAGSAALFGETAYIGNYSGRFTAVDLRALEIRWSFSIADNRGGFAGSPAVTERFVVIGGKDSVLYCFEREGGKLLWQYRTTDEIVGSPLIGGDRVVAAAADGELTVLELETGTLLSGYSLGAEVKGSPAYAAGFLAVPALDGNIYLFEGAENAP